MSVAAGLGSRKPRADYHCRESSSDFLGHEKFRRETAAACGFAMAPRLRYVPVALMDSRYQLV